MALQAIAFNSLLVFFCEIHFHLRLALSSQNEFIHQSSNFSLLISPMAYRVLRMSGAVSSEIPIIWLSNIGSYAEYEKNVSDFGFDGRVVHSRSSIHFLTVS